MTERNHLTRWLAFALVLALQVTLVPTVPAAEQVPATGFSGTIVSGDNGAPLAGARLHIADPGDGRIYSTEPTGADGKYDIADLPAASYELAVEQEGGLYMVEGAVKLAPGTTRQVNLTVSPSKRARAEGGNSGRIARAGIWESPLTAALVVVGSAFVIGALVSEATDDDDEQNTSSASFPR